MNKSTSFVGILAILFSTMIYGSFGVFTRHLSNGFQPLSQQYSRSIFILLFTGIYILIYKNKKNSWVKIKREDLRWFFLLILSSLFDVVLIFIAFNHTSIATSYFLFYSSIIITGMVLGRFLFADKLDTMKVVSLTLIFLGLVLVFSLEVNNKNVIYLFLALLSGISVGAWNVFSKKLSSKYSTEQIIFVNFIFVAIVGFIISLLFGENLPIHIGFSDLAWLVGFSIAGLLAMALVIIGFRYLEAQKASLLMPVEIVFAVVFGYLFYGELISPSTLAGGVLIFIGAMIPNLNKNWIKGFRNKRMNDA